MTIEPLKLPGDSDDPESDINLRLVPSIHHDLPRLTLSVGGFGVTRDLGMHETDKIIKWLTAAVAEIRARVDAAEAAWLASKVAKITGRAAE